MALCETGAVVGSVSGGCIEDDLIDQYTKAFKREQSLVPPNKNLHNAEFPQGAPKTIKYGISADEAHRFGLPCGGTLELLLEFDPDLDLLDDLLLKLSTGQLMQRKVDTLTGAVTLFECSTPAELSFEGSVLINTFGPEYRMLLIGAGQMAQYLSTMASFNGFAVSVCDPREEYTAGWSVQEVSLSKEMPDDMVLRFKADRRSCVIALSHDPKLDDLAIIEALNSDAFYVGAIGSRKNNAARKQRLREHFDVSDEKLSRLRGPIGLYIGSKTPAEIAVSIMAEVLAVKNNVSLSLELQVEHAKNNLQTS
jgi:xanthine dehydrogenase accessory factor